MIEPKIGVPFEYEEKWYVARREGLKGLCGPKRAKCVFYNTACEHIVHCGDTYIRPARLRNALSAISRLYDWFWSDDPIAQRFRIGYAVVVILGLAGCVFGLGLMAGRSGL